MKTIKHKELPVASYGYIDTSECPCIDQFAHYLWMAAPKIKWYYVEDVGSYQGEVYAVGKYKDQWFVYHDYYGSCSGCGAWGEGGEPEAMRDVLENGELFDTKKKAYEFAKKTYGDSYEKPTEGFWKVLKSDNHSLTTRL